MDLEGPVAKAVKTNKPLKASSLFEVGGTGMWQWHFAHKQSFGSKSGMGQLLQNSDLVLGSLYPVIYRDSNPSSLFNDHLHNGRGREGLTRGRMLRINK